MEANLDEQTKSQSQATLELMFFIPQSYPCNTTDLSDPASPHEPTPAAIQYIKLEQLMQVSLLDYQQHYVKDIEAQFAEVAISDLMICPRILKSGWEARTPLQVQQQRQKGQIPPFCFPVFYDRHCPAQYFQQTQELISVIFPWGDEYRGFLGYVPAQLNVLDIVRALATNYHYQLSHNTFLMAHLRQLCMELKEWDRVKVKDVAGSYIKVFQFSTQSQRQQQRLQTANDNFGISFFQEESAQHRHVESEVTNLGAPHNQSRWMSQNEIETCFEMTFQPRHKLIDFKNSQQIERLRNYTRQAIAYPKIGISRLSQPQMVEKLEGISWQIEKLLLK